MRCRQCNYRLWNLASRQCPECGKPFRPSEYEFTPNSVQFLCPHCRQTYYGTSSRGHLEPAAFNCVKCGTFLTMDDTLLLPADGVVEEQTELLQVPWLERQTRGRVRAWWATSKMALKQPQQMMAALPEGFPVGGAVWYSFVTNLLVYAVSFGPIFLIPMLVAAFGPGRTAPAAVAILIAVALVVGAAVSTILWMAIWALLTHGVLRVIAQPQLGLARTMQAICFSSGANVVTAVPCLGLYVGWIAWIVSAVLMVKRAQGVSGARAAIAVAGPPAVATVISMVGYLIFITQMIAVSNRFTTTRPVTPGMYHEALQTAMIQYAVLHPGKAVSHVGSLIWDGDLLPSDLVVSGGEERASRIQLGDVSIGELEAMPLAARRARRDAALQALPANQPVYRLGDYVFTHRGTKAISGTVHWIAIEWPASRGDDDLTPVRVIPNLGTMIQISPAEFPTALAGENARRAADGIAPIPDPKTVGATTSEDAERGDE